MAKTSSRRGSGWPPSGGPGLSAELLERRLSVLTTKSAAQRTAYRPTPSWPRTPSCTSATRSSLSGG
eukprot:431527-Lingulodinium_polyedra.AAC.1